MRILINRSMRLSTRLFLAATAGLMLAMIPSQPGSSYDPYVYDNLKKSRDALLSQRDELQRALYDVNQQIGRLQSRQSRLDSYVKQVDQSLRDVEDALRRAS